MQKWENASKLSTEERALSCWHQIDVSNTVWRTQHGVSTWKILLSVFLTEAWTLNRDLQRACSMTGMCPPEMRFWSSHPGTCSKPYIPTVSTEQQRGGFFWCWMHECLEPGQSLITCYCSAPQWFHYVSPAQLRTWVMYPNGESVPRISVPLCAFQGTVALAWASQVLGSTAPHHDVPREQKTCSVTFVWPFQYLVHTSSYPRGAERSV